MPTEDPVIEQKEGSLPAPARSFGQARPQDEKLGEPGLKALEAVKAENKAYKEQLARFKDVDPDKYRELTAAQAQAEQDRLKKQGDFDALTKVEQQKVTAAEQERDNVRAELASSRIETAFDRAFATVKGFPESSEVVYAYAKTHMQYDPESKSVLVIDPANGQPRSKDGKPVTVAALLDELRANPATARNFAPPDAVKGAGMSAGNGRRALQTQATGPDTRTPAQRLAEARRQQGDPR